MSDSSKTPFEPFFEEIRRILREEIGAANGNKATELLKPDELAKKLKIDISWIYEQSRLGNIPTHRFGCYIRFDLGEVLGTDQGLRRMEDVSTGTALDRPPVSARQ